MFQSALDPSVAPAGVLDRHPDNQLTDLLHHTGTTYTLSWIGPFRGDEFAMPRQDRIGRYDCSDRLENLPAQGLPFGSQSATLVIGKIESLPAGPNLFFEDSVLFNQISDHARLATSNPASERSQKELKMDGFNHVASISKDR
jgi:hypothetical protein